MKTTLLDLFSGTGNISYEFASRGAIEIVAVDMHRECVRFISKTSDDLEANIQAVQADALQWVRRNTTQYDIVFADPPYDYEYYEDLARGIMDYGLLTEVGEAIIEHSDQTDLIHLPGFLEHRRYGHVNFSFFSLRRERGLDKKVHKFCDCSSPVAHAVFFSIGHLRNRGHIHPYEDRAAKSFVALSFGSNMSSYNTFKNKFFAVKNECNQIALFFFAESVQKEPCPCLLVSLCRLHIEH